MKMRIASLSLLTVCCLMFAVAPAMADITLYDNGPINGEVGAWQINGGYVVSDSFRSSLALGSLRAMAPMGLWEFPGDVLTSLDWSVTSLPNSGTVYGSGTASGENLTDQFISVNQYGYDIDLITMSDMNVSLNPGTSWFNLQNAVSAGGNPVYWDENSGVGCQSLGCPSQAYDSAVGTIPSEAFTLTGTIGTTPEPSSILLFGSGILGLASVLRRKLL